MSDVVDRFRRGTTAERAALIRDDALAASLRSALGEAAYDEYRRLVGEVPSQAEHLGASTPKNVVFVPGVMGSLLENRTRGGVSWIDVRTISEVGRLRLAPNGLADADEDDRISPFNIDVTYAPFLTLMLRRSDFGVEMFPYDWRKPLAASTERLRDLIVSTHDSNGGEPVHLVAHSMGGLLVRTALLRHGSEIWPRIGKIAFVGTPHFGSPAIAGYLKNHLWGFELMAVLGVFLKRDALRSMWGVLSMLPAPVGVYPGTRHDGASYDEHPCVNFDPYQAQSWRLELPTVEEDALQGILDAAKTAHQELWNAHRQLSQDQRDRMLVVAGVGYRTLFRIAYHERFFGLWERAEKESTRRPGDPHREGDGRVPVASAALDWTMTRYVRGVHGSLMNLPAVQATVLSFLSGQPPQLAQTPSGALAGHLGSESISTSPALDGASRIAGTDDPGLWDAEEIDPTRFAELLDAVSRGDLPQLERISIM